MFRKQFLRYASACMQLHECVGAALGAMGPQTFLNLLPLNLEAVDQSDANIWLFPILKQYTVGAHLSFFTDTILGMVGQMKKKSRRVEVSLHYHIY